jgi:hypothetical protein
MFTEPKGDEIEVAYEKLVDVLYLIPRGTRNLFLRITGMEWRDETQALASPMVYRTEIRCANKEMTTAVTYEDGTTQHRMTLLWSRSSSK